MMMIAAAASCLSGGTGASGGDGDDEDDVGPEYETTEKIDEDDRQWRKILQQRKADAIRRKLTKQIC